MREKVTRILLTKLEKHTPPRIKSIQLQILLNATAAAADTCVQPEKMPPRLRIWHLPAEEALAAYASYTTACLSGLSGLTLFALGSF